MTTMRTAGFVPWAGWQARRCQ